MSKCALCLQVYFLLRAAETQIDVLMEVDRKMESRKLTFYASGSVSELRVSQGLDEELDEMLPCIRQLTAAMKGVTLDLCNGSLCSIDYIFKKFTRT